MSVTVILFPVSLIIWFLTYPFDNERTLFHWWMVIHSIIIVRLIPIWKIEISGREKVNRGTPYIIISNHQSMLDILILNCLRYRYRWISKVENSRVPVLGWYLKMAKYITIDRGNPESREIMLGKSVESLRKGISIMIFPEGTRSLDSEIGPFKLGAFQMAIMADKTILPVIVDGTGKVLPKRGLVFSPGQILKIRILDPVHPGMFNTSDPEELAQKMRNLMVEELNLERNKQKLDKQRNIQENIA
jgi:1-acyl-sn-glycerol-3-phosphate acyltransferase